MDHNSKKIKKKSRREFLQKFGIAGSGVIAATALINSGCTEGEEKSAAGKRVKLLGQDNQLVEVDISQVKPVKDEGNKDYLQKRGRKGIPGKEFVMVIDLAKCRNARKCMTKCQSAHQLKPEQHHINVLDMKDPDNKAAYFMPKPCQHCDNPACVSVCPVDATFKRSDGIVLIDNERCIGCRFCISACPYSARSFNWTDPLDAEKYADKVYDVELNVPQKKGTVTKCAFSADRLRENKLPYCVSACPNEVYYFGNAREDLVTNGTTKKTVRLSHLLHDNAAYTLMPELGTKPRVYYLPPNREKS